MTRPNQPSRAKAFLSDRPAKRAFRADRNVRSALLCVAAGLATLAFTAAPASAEHTFSGTSFGEGTFMGVAIDQETGNVYTTEGGGLGPVFGASGGSPAGEPILGFKGQHGGGEVGGVAIDNACYYRHLTELTMPSCKEFDPSNGDVYLASEHSLQKFALNVSTHEYEVVQELPSGTSSKFNGVATDQEGNVYAVEGQSRTISKFNTKGEKVGSIEVPRSIAGAEYIAAGVPGVLYVGGPANLISGSGEEGVAKIVLDSNGQVQSEAILDKEGFAAAVDQQGNVYIDNGSSVSEYDAAGTLLGRFGVAGEGALKSDFFVGGVGVNDATGQVYVPSGYSGSAVMEIFDPVVVLGPEVSDEQVTNVEATAATLQASIDPHKSPTTYRFEYDTTPYPTIASHGTSLPSHGTRVPEANVSIGSGESPVPVSVRPTGLASGTTYYYRVIAVSEAKPSEPEEFAEAGKTFTTNAASSSAPETCPNAQARTEQPYGQALPELPCV